MQRAHQVLSVLLDPLATEALRAMSVDKVPQAVWVRLGRIYRDDGGDRSCEHGCRSNR